MTVSVVACDDRVRWCVRRVCGVRLVEGVGAGQSTVQRQDGQPTSRSPEEIKDDC